MEENFKIDNKKRSPFTLMLEDEVKEKLKDICVIDSRSITDQINVILREAIFKRNGNSSTK